VFNHPNYIFALVFHTCINIKTKQKVMRYVYALVDEYRNVLYIGETKDPKWRLYDHTRRTRGRFYGRTDVTLHVISCHLTRKESYQAQCQLQEVFGLKSDLQVASEAFAKGREILAQKKRSQ
jgi:predicted GIY-YIG superfamily endonuclease